MPAARVQAVQSRPTHGFTEQDWQAVLLRVASGLAGDAHSGTTAQRLPRRFLEPV